MSSRSARLPLALLNAALAAGLIAGCQGSAVATAPGASETTVGGTAKTHLPGSGGTDTTAVQAGVTTGSGSTGASGTSGGSTASGSTGSTTTTGTNATTTTTTPTTTTPATTTTTTATPTDPQSAGQSGTPVTSVATAGLPAGFTQNPLTNEIFNAKGEYVRGTTFALQGEAALPKSDANAAITAVDGSSVNYIDAGNSIFVSSKNLTPSGSYTANLVWPNGNNTTQDFMADANGNVKGVSGDFIEFPHLGFHHLVVSQTGYAAITGQYTLTLTNKGTSKIDQTIYFAVRKRPVVMVTNKDYQEQTVLFSDMPAELYFHGSGFPPNAPVSFTVIHADVNRLDPMKDGQDLSAGAFENLTALRFHSDANGNVHAPMLSWTSRTSVADDLVVVGKYLNSQPKFVASQDAAIMDHPTFVIKSSQEYFASINAGATTNGGGTLSGTNLPAGS